MYKTESKCSGNPHFIHFVCFLFPSLTQVFGTQVLCKPEELTHQYNKKYNQVKLTVANFSAEQSQHG